MKNAELERLNTEVVAGQTQTLANGYRAMWTGFKVSAYDTLLHGQWVAYKKGEDERFYAATPGKSLAQTYLRIEDLDELGWAGFVQRARIARDEAYDELERVMREAGAIRVPVPLTVNERLMTSQETPKPEFRFTGGGFPSVSMIDALLKARPFMHQLVLAGRESIRHEPVGNYPASPEPRIEIEVEEADVLPKQKYRCLTCRAEDLDERDIQSNPKKPGRIYGCWHCQGTNLERVL